MSSKTKSAGAMAWIFDGLQKMARPHETRKLVLTDVAGLLPGESMVLNVDGDYSKVGRDRWRRYVAGDLVGFSRMMRLLLDRMQDEMPGLKPLVVVGDDGVLGILDEDGEQGHTVAWPLTMTRPWSWLFLFDRTHDPQPIPHHTFIRELRVLFANGRVKADEFNALKNLNFRSHDETESEVERGYDSLSRSVHARVTAGSGDAEIPETITLTVQVYRECPQEDLLQEVECVVEHTRDATIALIPFEGQMQAARDAVLRGMVEMLDEGLNLGIGEPDDEKTPIPVISTVRRVELRDYED